MASIDSALAPGATELHPDGNEAFSWSAQGGDVDRAFAEADLVTDLEVRVQRVIPNAIEPRAVRASYDPETESLTVWSTTQIPHGLRDELAQVIGVPAEKIRAIAPEVGGGFVCEVQCLSGGSAGSPAGASPEASGALGGLAQRGLPGHGSRKRSDQPDSAGGDPRGACSGSRAADPGRLRGLPGPGDTSRRPPDWD